jgi:broad specificity phosphatase PhoE
MSFKIGFLRLCLGWFVALAALCHGIGGVSLAQGETVPNSFTTVLVMRHADRNRAGDLTVEGRRRALDLVHVLGNSGIKAIFTTDMQRTKDTASPLAACLGLQPEVYGRNLQELADKVRKQHQGSVVLVIGHDSTVEPIVEALIGRKVHTSLGIRFDDLHIVTTDQSGKGNAFSIKFGNPLSPAKCGEN